MKRLLMLTIILACCALTGVQMTSAATNIPYGKVYQLPDTGQTSCYDSSGSTVACLGFGQDGDYTITPPSYTKLDSSGNALPGSATSWAMVRDNVTGLIWEVKEAADENPDYGNIHDGDNTYTWYDSDSGTNGGDSGEYNSGTNTEEFINSLNSMQFGGSSDWRLPTAAELVTIMDFGSTDDLIDPAYFPHTRIDYWTSTTDAYDPASAYNISFSSGLANPLFKTGGHFVRAVRGGTGTRRHDNWADMGDSTVYDPQSGLMWEVKTDYDVPGPRDKDHMYTPPNAFSYCENLTLAGHTDWRLPNIKELYSLIDPTVSYPAINTDAFPYTQWDAYWSSTSDPYYGFANLLAVGFQYGRIESYPKDMQGLGPQLYVRAVRGPLCLYILSSESKHFTENGGTTSFSLTTAAGCSWSVSENLDWVSVQAGSGTGSATISYTVSPNNSISTRTGTISIGGKTFTITQDGASCTYSLSPASKNFNSSGGQGSVSVTTPMECTWSASENIDWVEITSSTAGMGNASVTYRVLQNTTTSTRTGTIAIGDRNHTISQEGLAINDHVEGTVYENSSPVSGVSVYMYSESLKKTLSTQTDANGEYAFYGIPAATDWLIYTKKTIQTGCTASFYYTLSQDKTPGTDAPAQSAITKNQARYLDLDSGVHLALMDLIVDTSSVRTISGYVKGDDGAFLADYAVGFYAEDLDYSASAVTGGNGYYTFCPLPDSTSVILHAGPAPGQTGNYFPGYYDSKPDANSADRLTLSQNLSGIDIILEKKPANSIQGQVKNASGLGISGVTVQVSSRFGGYTESQRTDSGGNYTVSGLVPASDYLVSVASSVNGTPMTFYYQSPSRSTLLLEEATYLKIQETTNFTSADIILETPADPITGVVYGYQEGGGYAPVSGVEVIAWSPVLETGSSVKTGTDGSYTLYGLKDPVTPATHGYILKACSRMYADRYYDNVSTADAAERVDVGTADVDFYLIPEVSLSGVVTDESGKAISGALVTASSEKRGVSGSAKTDGTGNFVIDQLTPSADYLVSVTPGSAPTQWYKEKKNKKDADPVNLTHGDASIQLVYKKGGTIHGKIYLGSYLTPVNGGVAVIARSSATGFQGMATVDATGSFEITGLDLQATDYILSAYKNGHPPVYYQDNGDGNPYNDTVYIRENVISGISPGTTSRHLVFPAGITIRGTVTSNNQPVGNIRITAIGTRSGANYSFGEAVTQERLSGGYNYAITGLPGGTSGSPVTYAVTIQPPAGYAKQTRTVTVTTQDIEVSFDLGQQSGYSISGTVFNLETGKSITLNAWSSSLASGKSIVITGEGDPAPYTIEALPPSGDYAVSLLSREYPGLVYRNKAGHLRPDPVSILTGSRQGIDFTLPDLSVMHSIFGKVYFPGSAVAGETVYLEAVSLSNGIRTRKKVVCQGPEDTILYSFPNLPPYSDYLVSAHSPRYGNRYYENALNPKSAKLVNLSSGNASNIHFHLDYGFNVSGNLTDENGTPLPGIPVQVWSPFSEVHSHAISDETGAYTVQGLEARDDYIIQASDHVAGYGDYYYHPEGTVRDKSLAARITTMAGNLTGMDMILDRETLISGTVRDESGALVPDVNVTAFSSAVQAGNTTRTEADGTYAIKGLPVNGIFTIRAIPDQKSMYLPAELADIQAGREDVHLTLPEKSASFSLEGTVKNSAGQGVPGITVSVVPLWEAGFSGGTGVSEGSAGNFSVSGLIPGDYLVSTWTDIKGQYGVFKDTITISSDTSISIVLESSRAIEGIIRDVYGDGINEARVHVWSQQSGFRTSTYTSQTGQFSVKDMPSASDYHISASKEGYALQEETLDMSTTILGSITMTLHESAGITGIVRDEAGMNIEGARLMIYSQARPYQRGFYSTVSSDENGEYAAKGLRKYDGNGNPVCDYVVIADHTAYLDTGETSRYMRKMSAGNCVPAEIDFRLIQVAASGDDPISGVVANLSEALNTLSAEFASVDAFDADGTFVTHAPVNSQNSSFVLEALDSRKSYYLGFGIYTANQEIIYQWAGEGGTAISNTDHTPPPGAALYPYGTPGVVFTFDLAKRAASPGTIQTVARVKNLRTPSHAVSLPETAPGFRAGVDEENIARTPADPITNNPYVTVEWEPSSSGADESYYYVFNQNSAHIIDKRNAVQPSAASRSATCGPLAGDGDMHYFHVAVEDDRGRIGPTTSLGFAIDTVAPQNPYVGVETASYSSGSGNVNLMLSADGADEMALSNPGYGGEGAWEPYATTRSWTLPVNSTQSIVYAQYRDSAGNLATTSTVATLTPDTMLGKTITILQAVCGEDTSPENQVGNDTTGLPDAIYLLQKAAGKR